MSSRKSDDRHRPLHDVPDISSLRPLLKIGSAVGPRPESLAIRDVERSVVGTDCHAGREPRRGDISQNFRLVRVQHGDGIDAAARYVQPLFIRAERHAERQHSSQAFDGFRRFQHDRFLHLVRPSIEDRDAVLRGVGDETLLSCPPPRPRGSTRRRIDRPQESPSGLLPTRWASRGRECRSRKQSSNRERWDRPDRQSASPPRSRLSPPRARGNRTRGIPSLCASGSLGS